MLEGLRLRDDLSGTAGSTFKGRISLEYQAKQILAPGCRYWPDHFESAMGHKPANVRF